MSKQDFINKHFGVLLTGIVTIAIAISSTFISIRQIEISRIESGKRIALDSLKYQMDVLISNQKYELELSQFILQTRDSLNANPQYANYTIKMLRWTFSNNDFVASVLDSIANNIDSIIGAQNKIDLQMVDSVATQRSLSLKRDAKGWIYIGEFTKNTYGNTKTIKIPDILPQVGEEYKTVKNLYLRFDYPRGLFYKMAGSKGIIAEDTRIKILEVNPSVGWKGNYVWARVKVVATSKSDE